MPQYMLGWKAGPSLTTIKCMRGERWFDRSWYALAPEHRAVSADKIVRLVQQATKYILLCYLRILQRDKVIRGEVISVLLLLRLLRVVAKLRINGFSESEPADSGCALPSFVFLRSLQLSSSSVLRDLNIACQSIPSYVHVSQSWLSADWKSTSIRNAYL